MARLAPLLLLLAQRQLGAAASPAPPCRAAATDAAARRPPPTLPRGVVSVTSFGADPSGADDSTAALQRALTAARLHRPPKYFGVEGWAHERDERERAFVEVGGQ